MRRSWWCVAGAVALISCAPDPSTAPATTTSTSTTTTTTSTTTTSTTTTTTAEDPEPEPPEESSTTTDSTTTTTTDPTADEFGWEPWEEGRSEYGYLEVPLDWDDPNGETIELSVGRWRARVPDERIGVLLVNPGGPGLGGSWLSYYAEEIYGDRILDHFDIVGWDPRGTGDSYPWIDCIDEYERYFAIEISPDSAEEEDRLADLAAAFSTGCEERTGELLEHISAVDSARDMDAIRDALGEETVSYLGHSYGSTVGAVWATLFPDSVRAAVLDGALDPTLTFTEVSIQQAIGFDRALTAFLADCSARPSCAFHNDGDASAAFTALAEQIEIAPVPTEFGRPDVVDGVFESVVSGLLYHDATWPDLARLLDGLQEGDASDVLDLWETAEEEFDPMIQNFAEAAIAITCVDAASRLPRDEAILGAIAARPYFDAVSRFGDSLAYRALVCASFAPTEREPLEVGGADRAGPIMVVGTTGDPATPYEGAVAMAGVFDTGFLLTVEGDFHTAHGNGICATNAMEVFLEDLEIPVDVVCE